MRENYLLDSAPNKAQGATLTSFENTYYETTEQTYKYGNLDHTKHRITVAVRRWFCDYSKMAKEDAILQTFVVDNGEVVTDTLQFLPIEQDISWYQRKGMQAFDAAINCHSYFAAHPKAPEAHHGKTKLY